MKVNYEHEGYSKFPWYWQLKQRNARLRRRIKKYENKIGKLIILMSSEIKKHKVMLDLPEEIADWIIRAKAIRKALADNLLGYFSPAWAGLAQLLTDLGTLDLKQQDVANKVADAVNARNIAMNRVELDLDNCLLYIQGLVNATPDKDKAIAEAAFMKLVPHGVHEKSPLKAIRGKLSRQIKLMAKALGRNFAYEYQVSIDNCATWTACGTANKATLILSGMSPLTKYWFRFRGNNKDGPGDWIYCVPVICL